ncbi:MAG: hypothetical protein ABIN48_02340 [Ginsengibacter sp.]
MKKLLIIVLSGYLLGSCSLFSNQKLGCKTNGKNVGAERILSGDKQAMKAAKRAKKFKY